MVCPNPTSMKTATMTLTQSYSSDVAHPTYIYWKCVDRRYLIRKKNTNNEPRTTKASRCNWSKSYSSTPEDLECLLTYCDNPISPPASANYDFNWDNSLVNLSRSMSYPCKSNYKVEQNTELKSQADSATAVKCNNNGEYDYPATWPQCSSTITCADPGNSPGITRTYTYRSALRYRSRLKWECDDKRKWVKLSLEPDTALVSYKTARCEWRKSYPVDGRDLVCVIHHCRHPHDEPGKHQPPDPQLQLNLRQRQVIVISS